MAQAGAPWYKIIFAAVKSTVTSAASVAAAIFTKFHLRRWRQLKAAPQAPVDTLFGHKTIFVNVMYRRAHDCLCPRIGEAAVMAFVTALATRCAETLFRSHKPPPALVTPCHQHRSPPHHQGPVTPPPPGPVTPPPPATTPSRSPSITMNMLFINDGTTTVFRYLYFIQ